MKSILTPEQEDSLDHLNLNRLDLDALSLAMGEARSLSLDIDHSIEGDVWGAEHPAAEIDLFGFDAMLSRLPH